MAKTYQVKFDILGGIDKSLLDSIKKAQANLEALGKLNGKAFANAQKLSAAQKKLNDISQYKDLTRAVQAAAKARANELVSANRQLAAHKAATRQLDEMKKSYRELQKVQTRLKRDATVQRDGVDLARAGLQAAKKSGDINQIKAAQDALQRQQESARRAAQAVKDINDALKLGRADLKAQQSSVKDLGNNFSQASARAAQLQQQLAQQYQHLNQLRAASPSNIGQAEVHLRQEIQATNAALQQELALIERRNRAFSNFSQRQQDLSNAYSNFQNAIDTAQSLMNPFKDAADNAKTFEFAMSQVKALTSMQNIRDGNLKQVEKDMAALTAQAEKLGATTEFTATEVADAMKYYGYAGWNAQQIQAVMNQTVDMATVTGKHNIARMADVFSDDLTILGIKAGDQIQLAGGKMVDAVTHTFDNYSYAITKANMDEEALHASLTYNAPAMMLAGLSQGEIFASNMIAANAGLKGSTSGTAFRTGWIRMLAPPKKGAKALEELGLTATESQKQMAAASEAFAELGVTATSTARDRLMALKNAWDANEQLGEEGRGKNAAMLDAIIGKNAFSTWANLFKGDNLQQMLEWADYMDSGKTAGWTADTAAVMRDNTQTQIELLNSSIDALEKATGDALLPAISQAAETFAPLIQSAAEWVAEHPRVVQACAAIATALSAAMIAATGFSLAMAGIRFAQAGLATASLLFGNLSSAILVAARAAMTFAFTPVGAALTAIAVAAYLAYQNWDKIGPAISRVSDVLSNGLVNALVAATGLIGSLVAAIAEGISGLVKMIGELGTGLADSFSNLTEGNFSGAFSTLIDTATNAASNFKNAWLDSFSAFYDGIQATNSAMQSLSAPSVQSDALTSTFDAQIDTSAAQGNIDELGSSAQIAAAQMQNIESAGTNIQSVADAAQISTEGFTTAGENALNAGTLFQSAGDIAAQSVGGLQSMVDGASAVAGALASKAAEISAIQINVPQVNYVPMNIGVPTQHLASGGIFPRGEFLTTFAENSPEAAIPLDNSARAINLWTQAGDALGIWSQTKKALAAPDSNSPISINLNVNVYGKADEETIQRGIENALPRVRSFAQDLAAFNHEQRRRSFA